MKTITFIFAVVVASSTAVPLTSEKDAKDLADKFMNLVGKGSYREAFDQVKLHWPLPAPEIDNMAYQTETQLKMVTERFGKLLGQEFIQSNSIGKSYLRYIYIQKFENHATRWMVVFYRPSKEWKVNAINWDDQTHELFKIKGDQNAPPNGSPTLRQGASDVGRNHREVGSLSYMVKDRVDAFCQFGSPVRPLWYILACRSFTYEFDRACSHFGLATPNPH